MNNTFNTLMEYICGQETKIVVQIGNDFFHEDDLKNKLNIEKYEIGYSNYLKKIDVCNEIQEAKYLLESTQFKFGEDYDKKYTPEWEELKVKRAEARQFIRENRQDGL